MTTKQQIVPTHPAWTHSGLRERISWAIATATGICGNPIPHPLSLALTLARPVGAVPRSKSKSTSKSGRKSLSPFQAAPYSPAVRTILLIVLILLLIGVFPGWGYSSGWGYKPFGGIGLLLLIIIILVVMVKL